MWLPKLSGHQTETLPVTCQIRTRTSSLARVLTSRNWRIPSCTQRVWMPSKVAKQLKKANKTSKTMHLSSYPTLDSSKQSGPFFRNLFPFSSGLWPRGLESPKASKDLPLEKLSLRDSPFPPLSSIPHGLPASLSEPRSFPQVWMSSLDSSLWFSA